MVARAAPNLERVKIMDLELHLSPVAAGLAIAALVFLAATVATLFHGAAIALRDRRRYRRALRDRLF